MKTKISQLAMKTNVGLTTRQQVNLRADLAKSMAMVGQRLVSVANGTEEASAPQVSAMKLYFDKVLPNAPEPKEEEQREGMTLAEMEQALGAMIRQNPELMKFILKANQEPIEGEIVEKSVGTSEASGENAKG